MAQKKTARKRPAKTLKAEPTGIHAEKEKAEEVAAQSPAPLPQDDTPRDEYVARIYIVSWWKGLRNYECLFCAMATLDRDDAIEHYQKVHAPVEPTERIINTGLVGEDGTPITRVESAKED